MRTMAKSAKIRSSITRDADFVPIIEFASWVPLVARERIEDFAIGYASFPSRYAVEAVEWDALLRFSTADCMREVFQHLEEICTTEGHWQSFIGCTFRAMEITGVAPQHATKLRQQRTKAITLKRNIESTTRRLLSMIKQLDELARTDFAGANIDGTDMIPRALFWPADYSVRTVALHECAFAEAWRINNEPKVGPSAYDVLERMNTVASNWEPALHWEDLPVIESRRSNLRLNYLRVFWRLLMQPHPAFPDTRMFKKSKFRNTTSLRTIIATTAETILGQAAGSIAPEDVLYAAQPLTRRKPNKNVRTK
jgi:hypothetical protein